MFSADPQPMSPAERYQAAASRAEFPRLTAFAARQAFQLDAFQVDACRALERGENVLVCAPTGAGKTLVGEFAAASALADGGRCFYTTPIKALSNQKYADFGAEYGAESVGLLTGDTTINPGAPLVVMTTEVLRNMLYVGSPELDALAAVVLDEVHYLADKFRGAVWEEVILHLAEPVQVVGLSATVSNAEEFGDWIRTVRGPTAVVVDEVRPVPLWQHMMVGSRLYDLFAHETPTVLGGRPSAGGDDGGRRAINPSLLRAVNRTDAEWVRSGAPPRGGRRRGHDGPRWRGAPRPVVIDRLDAAGLLPAIVFVFSRTGCDAAVDQCVRGGLTLVDEDERDEIARIVAKHTAALPPEDLEALDFARWRGAWLRGIAAHHAGLLPAFKEAVEELFTAGLVKVVFATETLALGINMPARTVVLERLVKFDGESHADVTPGEYTQLTGRAGRRGIDAEGHAVVMFAPHLDPRAVGGLASQRTFPLLSSFRPTYNMAVNLVDRMGREPANSLLERSFAQFQADRTVVGRARQVDANRKARAALFAELTCDRGDAAEYTRLAATVSAAEKAAARQRTAERREGAQDDLAALKPGDVIEIDKGRRAGLAVVLDARPNAAGDVRPLVVTDQKWAGRVTRADFRGRVPAVGRLPLRRHLDHSSPKVRADLAAALVTSGIGRGRQRRAPAGAPAMSEVRRLQEELRRHPVHRCPELPAHLEVARRLDALDAQTRKLEQQVKAVRGSMRRELDRLCAVLAERAYLRGDRATARGHELQRIWLEADLLAADCLGAGLWRKLDAAALAAVVSGLVFDARGGQETPARALPGDLAAPAQAVEDQWRELVEAEGRHGVSATRRPDFGFAAAVASWVRGGSLLDCLATAGMRGTELSAGDFVRWCRQVADALDQLRYAGDGTQIPAAWQAIDAIRRGVVILGTR